MPEIEITAGFLMYWGGIALAAISIVGALVYFALSARKAKKLLKKIDMEDF